MENAKLMKTLFYNGRFNADGKRMRAVIDREVSNGQDRYRLWRKCGGPDHAYPQAENDTHLLYLELHGYLASLGMTEYSLIYESGRLPAIVELYGDMDGREKHLSELRKSEQAYTVEIPKALKIEGETIQRLGREPAHQADCIKKKMDEHTPIPSREALSRTSKTKCSPCRTWRSTPSTSRTTINLSLVKGLRLIASDGCGLPGVS